MKVPGIDSTAPSLGDMDPRAFTEAGYALVDWIARYLGESERYPVLAKVAPGAVRSQLPAEAPEHGESIERILADFERVLVPGLTHWNHPAFFAYFSSGGSGPGILGELLTAALNQQAMLWRTSPAATELEEVVLGWLGGLLGLSSEFEGVITDGGSASNLLALLAAREAAVPSVREVGLAGARSHGHLRVYCTEHTHSSVERAAIVLGLGRGALEKVEVDTSCRMVPDALATAIREDRGLGRRPLAVVAAVGTTSTAAVDPVSAIADVCERERIWLHVDAAYAGPAAMLPEHSWVFDGVARADSVVVNPHKWLFTPLDLSALYCRRMESIENALALTPDYLANREARSVTNLMDRGVQLARRFRALKLWMVIRYFGAEGIRARVAEHIRLARLFGGWVEADPDFELLAPVSLGLVCFRAAPRALAHDARRLDELNEALLERVNASGEVFLSHTRLDGRFTLRLAIGHIRTSEAHVARAWHLLRELLRESASGRYASPSTQ